MMKMVNMVPKPVLINESLSKDQYRATNPDVKTPFLSREDACQRLLPYHVYNSKVPSVREINKADETFDMVSIQLLDKIKRLKNKYHLLQLRESMRPCATPERVLLERLFLEDEEAALKADKALICEGKTLSLPPPPRSWLKSRDPKIKVELSDAESEFVGEKEEPVYKEDSDNLEAPVIDSCVDSVVPQNDNCERSPPTLKRIVIKPEPFFESDCEEPTSKKRLKFNCVKSESPPPEWGGELCKRNHKYSLCREEDIMTKLRKELNISPMETDEEDHVVDFEPPSGTNGLADFEPPVARTDESCDSSLLSSCRAEMKYDFDMSEWAEAYAAPESQAAVESILDLSGLDGLEDHLSQHSIPNGIQDDFGGYTKKQSAIKGIFENRSYFAESDPALDEAVRSILL